MKYALHTSDGMIAAELMTIAEAKARAVRETAQIRTAVDAADVQKVIGQFHITRVRPRIGTRETVLWGRFTRTGRIRWTRG